MNNVALDLGFIKIYWYSIMIMIGALVAIFLAKKESKRRNINEAFMINLIFYAFIFGLIGARLYYVLFNLDYFSNNVLEIFKIWNGGLAIHGGIILGTLTIIIYCKKYKVSILKVLDICAVGIIIAQAIGRWGNFFNQEAYGMQTTITSLQNLHIPNFIIQGMNINGTYYQPTFLYESIWNVIGFILLITIRGICKNLKTGQLTGIYLMWYSAGRFVIEHFRSDSLMFNNFKVAQIVSIILFVIGILLIFVISKKQKLYREDSKDEIRF